MKILNKKRLVTSAGVEITALAMPNPTVVYSESIPIKHNVGFATMLIKEAHAGGTGNVAVAAEYSLDDGATFQAVYVSDQAIDITTANGTLTVDPAIVASVANGTRMIVFVPRLATHMRLKFTPATDSVVTADLAYQEEF